MTNSFAPIVGLDIGGANIKIAVLGNDQMIWPASRRVCEQDQHFVERCYVDTVPFSLWKYPEQLSAVIKNQLIHWPQAKLVITMTGELADGFANRKQGVAAIVDAASEAAGDRDVVFYRVADADQNCWLSATEARKDWLSVAAANWHAIARIVGKDFSKGEGSNQYNGFLIDVGSTTTDIIPIRNGQPATTGKTDCQRLSSRELVYVGATRTPICSLIDRFRIDESRIPIAREFFATIADAFRIVGDHAEKSDCTNTADGRPASLPHSLQRMARMVCNDSFESIATDSLSTDQLLSKNQLIEISRQAIERAENLIAEAILAVVSVNQDLPNQFVLTGQGDWLAERIIRNLDLSGCLVLKGAQRYGTEVSNAVGAYAVARLAAQSKIESWSDIGELSPFSATAPERKDRGIHLRVIKLGGSLLDWPHTPQRISEWIERQPRAINFWMVGGGRLVDEIRRFDRQFGLDEIIAHSICLNLMSVTVRLINHWFPNWPVCQCASDVSSALTKGKTSHLILDFERWLKTNASVGDKTSIGKTSIGDRQVDLTSLTESWEVTSDSCAAYFAASIQADELVLLKSCEVDDLPCCITQNKKEGACYASDQIKDWQNRGIVDPSFHRFTVKIPMIRLVNLREPT